MGEAKRRRQLEPNYGTTQLCDGFAQIFDSFVNKQTDISIICEQDLSQPSRTHRQPLDDGSL